MPGPLVASLGLDISAYEKAMVRARDLSVRHASEISQNFVNAAANMNTALSGARGLANLPGQLNAARGAALGLAATGASVVAAYAFVSSSIKQANEQIDRFIKLGENAERTGLGVEFWQRFSEAAEQAKLSVKEVEDALKRAGNAVTPKFNQTDQIKNRLDELFQSGYLGNFESAALAQYRAAGSNEQRIRATVEAMRELRDLGEGLAAIDLAERLFGSDIAERIRSGRLEIEAIAESLDRQRNDLVKQEEVERAQEFRERLSEAYETINDFLGVSVSLEASGRALNDIWLMIAEGVAQATVNVSGFYDKIQKAQGILGDYLSTLKAIGAGTAEILAGNIKAKVEGSRVLYDKPAGPELPASQQARPVPLPPRRPLDIVLAERAAVADSPAKPKAAGSSATELDEIERFINALDKSTVSLKAQVDAFHLSNSEQAVALQLARAQEIAKQANRTLTEEETRRIRESAAAASAYKDKLSDLAQQQNQTAELARTLGNALSDSFADAILEGESLGDVLNSLAKQIARMALQAAFTGQGPLAGLFGTAPAASEGSSAVGGLIGMVMKGFAGGFADGGMVQGPGGPREDRVIARLSPGEFVVNAASTAKHRAVLEAINAGKLPAFASGGIVGPGSSITMPRGAAAPGASRIVTIAPAITVNTNGGGTPAQNADLAAQTAKAAEKAIRSIVIAEIMDQRRPGNMLSN